MKNTSQDSIEFDFDCVIAFRQLYTIEATTRRLFLCSFKSKWYIHLKLYSTAFIFKQLSKHLSDSICFRYLRVSSTAFDTNSHSNFQTPFQEAFWDTISEKTGCIGSRFSNWCRLHMAKLGRPKLAMALQTRSKESNKLQRKISTAISL